MNTIGTHNSSTFSQEHNRREYDEPHIDKNGLHETWIDTPVREAYDLLFDDALKKYNAKQTRKERKISSYYEHIKHKKNQHIAYEMVVGVYSNDGAVSLEQAREILREFVRTWSKRNPNLFLCGAYFHADEKGQPHIHIDYIPIAHGCKRGLETQTNLKKALAEMGLVTAKGKGTAQMQMQRANNEYLERLCRERGIEISHPGGGGLPKEAYIAKQELTKTEDKLAQKTAEFYKNIERISDTGAVVLTLQERQKALTEEESALTKSVAELAKNKATLEGEITDLQRQREKLPQIKKDVERLEKRERKLNGSINNLRNQETQLQQKVNNLKDQRDYYFMYSLLLETVQLLLKLLEKMLDKTKYKQVLNELKTRIETTISRLYRSDDVRENRQGEALQRVLEDTDIKDKLNSMKERSRWDDYER